MPLHVPPAPAPAQRSVLTALSSPTAVREAPTPALRAATADPVTAEFPLPVHVLDRVTPSGRAPHPRSTAWRFLIRSGGPAVAAADTMLTPDGWAFSHFFEGPYVASTEQALRQAESHRRPLPAAAAVRARAVHAHALAARRPRRGRRRAATRPPPTCWCRSPPRRPASRRTGRTASPNCCPCSPSGSRRRPLLGSPA